MDNFERQSIAIQNGIFLTFTVMYSMTGRKGLVLKYTMTERQTDRHTYYERATYGPIHMITMPKRQFNRLCAIFEILHHILGLCIGTEQ